MLNAARFIGQSVPMYIRRTAIKSKKSGGQYFTYRLVESRRTEKGVGQYTLLNLGTDFSLPKKQFAYKQFSGSSFFRKIYKKNEVAFLKIT